jgi:hypothetical protein
VSVFVLMRVHCRIDVLTRFPVVAQSVSWLSGLH